ncbi:MAG: serine/threonine protein kinase [Magnetococcales bacterium]|nr:serine/threonine protein kinase [Magnetococcales bacterium]
MAKTPPIHLPVGYYLAGYKIIKIIGSGGFGITYLSYDQDLCRQVAIKEFFPRQFVERNQGIEVVPKGHFSPEQLQIGLDRFVLEGQTLAQFRHSSLIGVIHFFRANGTAYLVMDYEIGESLTQHIQGHKRFLRGVRFTNEEIFRFVRYISSGLQIIHAAGIIHRDIKPDNIIIRKNGTPVLLDFGAARQSMLSKKSQDHRLTVIATPANAPPEQFMEDGEQGPWTDIYALGTVLYQMVTGHLPPSSGKRIQELTSGRPDPLLPVTTTQAGHYAIRILKAIDQALIIDLKKRPQSIQEWLMTMRVSEAQARHTDQKTLITRKHVPDQPSEADHLPADSLPSVSTADGRWITRWRKHACLMTGLLLFLVVQPFLLLGMYHLGRQTAPAKEDVIQMMTAPSSGQGRHSSSGPSINSDNDPPATLVESQTSLLSLTIKPTPLDALVRILNISPKYYPGIRLPPNSYHIEVSKPGYKTVRRWVTISNSKVVEEIVLAKE